MRGPAVGGRVFGRYTLVEILGRGGMGVVWRAQDDVLGEAVALKFLPDAVRWDPGAYEDLKDETRRARQLTHPHIIRIHDFVEDAGSAAIAMEVVEGMTLTGFRLARENKVLEPDEIAPWLPQLCAALDYAHQQARVVHRDLKPSNVMLTREGTVKVGDFGIARSMADSITRVSMMSAGTLVYMSPQQAMGEEPAPADDVYSLGATLYELLTGKPPFHTGDVRVQLFQRKPDTIAARRKALGHSPGNVPAVWEETIAACLAKDAVERPASAGEVARRLLAGAGSASREGLRRRRPSRRAAVLGVLGAAALIVAGWRFSGRGQADTVAPSVAFPSDATRALAAWNFDGDARDASGRGYDGALTRALPTADRFGRIDRALQLNGGAGVFVPDAPALRWGGARPFTAALWVRQDESPTLNGRIWTSDGQAVGSLSWALGFSDGKAEASLGRLHHPAPCAVTAPKRLLPGTWHHLALVSDGERLALFVDGRMEASRPLEGVRDASVPPEVEMRFGRPLKISSWALDGALDDARLWRRALSAQEVAALARQERPAQVLRTRGTYPDTDDLADVVRSEYGAGARVLDWTELKQWHRDDARDWVKEMRIPVGDLIGWVFRDGQKHFDEKRSYFVHRFDGKKPDYYGVHDEVGGMTLVLGSWYEGLYPVMAARPPPVITTLPLRPEFPGGAIRWKGPIESNRVALALTWRARLRAKGNAVAVRCSAANGPEWQAVLGDNSDDSFALALGAVARGGISRLLTMRTGEYEFTLVARDQRLSFRAVGVIGRATLFSENLSVEDFRLADLATLELTGGPETGLATATLVIE